MAETAALLVEHRLPAVPWRQWVLSFPGPLAVRLGYDRALLGRVCQRFATRCDGRDRGTATVPAAFAGAAASEYTGPMTEAGRKLLDEALALPERDRLELAEALFDSLSAEEQTKIDEAWRSEILGRMEQVRNGEVELEAWEDVRQAGRDALAQR